MTGYVFLLLSLLVCGVVLADITKESDPNVWQSRRRLGATYVPRKTNFKPDRRSTEESQHVEEWHRLWIGAVKGNEEDKQKLIDSVSEDVAVYSNFLPKRSRHNHNKINGKAQFAEFVGNFTREYKKMSYQYIYDPKAFHHLNDDRHVTEDGVYIINLANEKGCETSVLIDEEVTWSKFSTIHNITQKFNPKVLKKCRDPEWARQRHEYAHRNYKAPPKPDL